MNNEIDPKSEKAEASLQHLLKIYDILPENSCIIFRFYLPGKEKLLDQEVSIFKDETPFEKVKKIVEQAQDKYGDELYSLKMEWRPGFGNSIIFEINS